MEDSTGYTYEWYENGNKEIIYQMRNNKPHGNCHDYTLYGKKTTTKYRHGRRMYGMTYTIP